MILIDSSVWIDGFRRKHKKQIDLPSILTSQDEICVTPLIVTEILQGFKSDTDFQKAKNVLDRLTLIEPGLTTHLEAAKLFRLLRLRGITVRSTIDCIIAQTCIDFKLQLLTLDRDFIKISEHSKLQLFS